MSGPGACTPRLQWRSRIDAAVGLRAPALGLPLDRDAAVYAVIGGSLRDGALPYRDLIDHKQPLVYPVYGLLDLIAQRSGLVVHLASALVAGCTAWALWLALRPRIGRARAALVAAVALVLGASRYTQGFDLNTEVCCCSSERSRSWPRWFSSDLPVPGRPC